MQSITYRNKASDVFALTRAYYFRSARGWIMLAIFVLLTLPPTISSAPTEAETGFVVVTVIVIELVLVCALLLVYAVMVAVAVAAGRKRLMDAHTITLTDDAFIEATELNETVTKWAGIHRILLTRKRLFVYIAPGMAHIIPRRAFADEQEWTAFVENIKRQLARA